MGQVIAMKRNSGLTIFEILAMVVVLGVVAGITLPKFRLALYQSREGRTKTHLGDLRGGLAIYYSDNFGLYPSDEGTPETRLTAALTPKYINRIPYVELDHHYPENLNTVQDRFDNRGDWVYSMLNGFIAVNSWMPDTKGNPISSW
jgi:type II secretory pathway pseudopilin PulG